MYSADLSHENKEKHLVLPMDLTKSDEHAELLEIVLKKFGRVSIHKLNSYLFCLFA